MVGTTRSRVSFFLNKFRMSGFIQSNDRMEVHSSLLNIILHDLRKRLASVKSNAVMPGLVLPRNEWRWGYGLVIDIQASRGRVMSEEKRQMDLPAADLRFHSKHLRYDSDVRIDVWNLSLGLRPTHTRQ